MQYMLMCCFDEKSWKKMPDVEKDKIMREYGELIQRGASRPSLQVVPLKCVPLQWRSAKPPGR